MLHFIYNPTAGRGRCERARRALEPLLDGAGREHRFHPTSARGDARRIAGDLTAQGEHDIVAMGGDGTIHEVLNGCANPARLRLGIIPCGSGNDFAAAIGLPSKPEEALRLILDGAAKPTDYLDCAGVRCINVLGAGIDVEILRLSYRARFLKGSLNYYVSLLRALLRFHNIGMDIALNGRSSSHDGFLVCACNGRRIGGGIEICPDAVPDDGLMDVVLVNGLPRSRYPGALIRLKQRKILAQDYTLHERTDRLEARFGQPTTIQIDGELYDDLPFDVRVIKGGISIYRP